MALHTGTLGGLGQVGGPLETAGGASGGGAGGGGGLTNDPPQASTLTTAAHPPPFIKYAPTPYAPPVGDPYANGGSGGGGLVPYTEENAGQPPPVAPTPTIQMQQFPPQPQSQRLVQPPTIIDAGYYVQPCWGPSPPGPTGPPGTVIGQPQGPPPVQQQQQQQSNFDESLMNNGSVVVVSSASSSSPNCSTSGGCTVVSGLTVAGGGGGCGDRRLITPPVGPLPPPPSTTPMPGGLYGPRFATMPLYHHNPGATACISQQSSAAYMPMPPNHHDPTCLTPGFAGAPAMNGQRLYMPSPHSGVGLGPRMPPSGAPLRTAPALPFGYFPLAPPTPEGVTAAAMCPTAAPGPFSGPHGPSLLPPDQQGTTGRKTEPTTTKKKRTKTTKSRAAAARGGNGRGTGVSSSTNPPPKVVTVGPPAAAGLAGLPPPQMMGPGMMLPTSVSAPSQPSMWAPRPAGPIMTNGSMLPMAPPPPPSATSTLSVSCALPSKVVGLSVPPLNSVVHTPLTPHQHHPTAGLGAAATTVNSIAPPLPQACPSTIYTSPVPHPLPPEQTAERLVCPITNGTVVRPMVLHLDEEQARQSPNALQVRTFEFDVSKNHLETIVERPDLDIVVCSHLVHEPLQVCHWPVEAIHIRFNGTVFQLDRTTTADGQPAHRVCGVKSLCRPSRNVIEVFLSPSHPPSHHFQNYSLKDHRFAVFMAHMPAVSMVLDGLMRRVPEESLSLTKLLISSWRNRQTSGGQDQRSTSTTPPPTTNQSVVAEISLICPVFRSRMQIPGRLVGCHHLEVFDMEAYLHREAIWSRLLCPICSNGSPAGLDNLYIDYFLLNIIQLTPKTVSTVQVRSDGFWRLSPPLMWQLPPGIDQWQPIVGPPTQAFAFALQIGPTILMAQPSQPHLSPFQSQQQRPVTINGLEAAGQTPGRLSCGTMASPNTAETPTSSLVYSGLESSSGGMQNITVNPHHQPLSNQWNAENTAAYSNCSAQVINSASPNPLSSASATAAALSIETGVAASTNPAPQSTNCRKRVLSTSSAQCIAVLHPITQTEGQGLPSSMPDLRVRSEAVSSQASLPKSLPTTPILLKPSPPTSMPKAGGNSLCKRISGSSTNIGGGGGVCGGGIGDGGTQPSTSTSPSTQPPQKRPKVSHRQLTDEEVRWAFDGLSDLNHFDDPELIRFINSLPL